MNRNPGPPHRRWLAVALCLAAGLIAGCDDDDQPPAGAGAECSAPLDDVSGSPTGLALCAGGSFDRVEDEPCPPAVEGEDYRACTVDDSACREDADCGPGGLCIHTDTGTECGCVTQCATDADCGDDAACLCRSRVMLRPERPSTIARLSMCLPASCRASGDCGGAGCGLWSDDCGPREFACRTPDDTCRGDDDCPDGGQCQFDRLDGRWRCTYVVGPCD